MTKKKKHVRGAWSADEIRLVKKLFPSEGPGPVAEKLGCSVPAVKQRAYTMGLTMEGFRHWSADDVGLLRRLYPTADSKKLAEKLGRPLSAVRQRAYDMGLTKARYRLWSAEELKLLKKLYPRTRTKDIADKMGRSLTGIRYKAKELQLKKVDQRIAKSWSKNDVKLLKKLYPIKSRQEVAAQLGRSLSAVMNKAHQVGLKKTT